MVAPAGQLDFAKARALYGRQYGPQYCDTYGVDLCTNPNARMICDPPWEWLRVSCDCGGHTVLNITREWLENFPT